MTPKARRWGKWTAWQHTGDVALTHWMIRIRYRGGIGIDQFFEKHTQYRPVRRKRGT